MAFRQMGTGLIPLYDPPGALKLGIAVNVFAGQHARAVEPLAPEDRLLADGPREHEVAVIGQRENLRHLRGSAHQVRHLEHVLPNAGHIPAKILLAQDEAADKKLGIDFAEPRIAVGIDDFDASFLDALPELIDQPGPLPPCLDQKRLKLFVDRLQLPNEFRVRPHEHQIVVNHVGIAVFVPRPGVGPRPIAMRGDVDDGQLGIGGGWLSLRFCFASAAAAAPLQPAARPRMQHATN